MERIYCQECGRRTESQDADNPCCDACIEYLTAYDMPAYDTPCAPTSSYHPGAFIDADASTPHGEEAV